MDAQKTLDVKYRKTLLYTERNIFPTTGLDALGVRNAQEGFPVVASADPQVPIASLTFDHLSLDLEGLVLNADGRSEFLRALFSCLCTNPGSVSGSATNMDHMHTSSIRLVSCS